MKLKVLLLNVLIAVFFIAFSQQNINDLSVSYTQNFNGLADTGTTSSVLPANWHINISATSMTYKIDDGSANSGAIYSYGVKKSTDRALGSIASSNAAAKNIMYGMSFKNSTTKNIQTLTVTYTGELWRLGSKNVDTLFFQYSTNANDLLTGSWVSVSQLNFTTPDTTGTLGAKDGNLGANRKIITYTITGLNISPNATFWIKWKDTDGKGSDDGLAIDDLTVSYSGVLLTACSMPANNVTNVVSNAAITEIGTAFTKANGSQKTMVIYSKNATLSANPSDKINYIVGDNIGDGIVAYIGNALNVNFIVNKLLANTNYTLFFFPFNDSCSRGPLYKTSSIIKETIKTKAFPNTTPYYSGLDTTLTCESFKTVLKNRIKNGHTPILYTQIPAAFASTDMANGFIVDRYSTCHYPLLTNLNCPNTDTCQCYNRDHAVPQSWFGTGDNYPMYSDLNFIFPSDGYVNSAKKKNFPLGVTNMPYYTNGSGFKVGQSSISGYTGEVFEPGDQYKGDFARAYLYFVTRYEDSLSVFKTRYPSSALIDSNFTGLAPWLLKLLVQWNRQDPPSTLEISRNDSIYQIQGNRNPYIDHFEWVEKVFGQNGDGCKIVVECNQPDSVATNLTFTATTENSISGKFNKVAGGADGYVVIYRKGKSFLTTLTNNQTYTVGQLITKTSGGITDTSYVGYVSANANDTTFTIADLVTNSKYWIAIIPYKNCSSGKIYRSQFIENVNKNDTTTAKNTTCNDPLQAPDGLKFTNVTSSTISGKFNKAVGGADGYIVLYRPGSSFIASPTDGQNYVLGQIITKANGTFTDSAIVGYISANANDTTFTINGLEKNKLYWVAVIPFNNCPSGPSYRTVFIPNVNKNDTITDFGTAIKLNKELLFTVYPNPVSSNFLNIRLDKNNTETIKLNIIDITGKVLYNNQLPSYTKTYQIEMAEFSKGFYYLQLEDKNGTNTVSFIKQ